METNRIDTTSAGTLSQLEWVLTRCREATDIRILAEEVGMRAALANLGLPHEPEFLSVLRCNRPRSWSPVEYQTLVSIGAEPGLWPKLESSALSEAVLSVLSNDGVRPHVTGQLMLELEAVWPDRFDEIRMGAAALQTVVDESLMALETMWERDQFFDQVERAREALASVRYRFPPAPFPLPEDWEWVRSGVDLRSLSGYDPGDPRYRVELWRHEIRAGDLHFARDPAGECWWLRRKTLSSSNVRHTASMLSKGP